MESVATHALVRWSRPLARIDGNAVITAALAGGLVLYLGFAGGGYDIVISSQIALLLWWIVLIGAAWGVLPHGRLSRIGRAGLILFGAFVAWTALASTWSLSSELSLQELSRASSYLGVLLLGLSLHRDRERGLKYTTNAASAAIVTIAAFALISRLFPNSFPASHVTAAFLGGAQKRLGWPINYWNGLAALVALGLPLLLSVATSARTLIGQAAAAAGIPVLALCEFLTFSRGGAVASAVALIVFAALAPERFAKLPTMLVSAAGSAVLVAAALHRSALENGLTNHLVTSQGHQMLVAILLVCAGCALAQVGLGLAVRHGTLPRLLRVSPARARIVLAAGLIVLVIVGLGTHVPSRLSHAWGDFKRDQSVASQTSLPSRFGSLSGEGRYTYWKVTLNASSGRRLQGTGPGTFPLLWDPRAPFYSPVLNAHSLYVETLAETGVVGLVLLLAFFAVLLAAAVRVVVGSSHEQRTRAAAAAAALLAFMVGALVDWVWQLPVLPAAFMLIAAAVLAPAAPPVSARRTAAGRASDPQQRPRGAYAIAVRGGLIVLAAACIVAAGIPLATTTDVRQSQAAVAVGDLPAALADARSGARVEPDAASPQIQVALVQELRHDYSAAIAAATKATGDAPQEWTSWLVLSRLQAEAGHVDASIAAYRRARSLNPQSPLFHS